MRQEAIGIAINGREVKVAHMFREKHMLEVDFLETAILKTDIESEAREVARVDSNIHEIAEDAFALDSPYEINPVTDNQTAARDNTEALHSLLSRFTVNKTKTGFNITPSRVNYHEIEAQLEYNKSIFKGTLQDKINDWLKGFKSFDTVTVISRKDGSSCHLVCEGGQPPVIALLEQLNGFYKGNLFLSLMDTNEVSLINLARAGYDLQDSNEISVIIQEEIEFSRLIFMKGAELLTVAPIITENMNPNINDIVYSKIIYELDHQNITELSNILLAARASTPITKEFFEKKFPDARVNFIVPSALADTLSTQFNSENLSEYAIPIALAWKLVAIRDEKFISTNLLSADIIDRQKVLKLTLVSYLLLMVLGLTAFIFTWRITAQNIEIRSLKNKNIALEKRINSSEQTVQKVQQREEQILKLTRQLALSDSLSFGSEALLSFLEKLNQSVLAINTVWIDEIQSISNGYRLKGLTLKRESVPQISRELGGARVKKLTRLETQSDKIFAFEMDVGWTLKNFRVEPDKPEAPAILKSAEAGQLEAKTASQAGPESEIPKPAEQTPAVVENAGTRTIQPVDNNTTLQTGTPAPLPKNVTTQSIDKVDKGIATNEIKVANNSKHGSNVDEGDLISEKSSPASPEPVSRTRDATNYTIRISAHVTRISAGHEINMFKSKGYDAFLTQLPGAHADIPYAVCLGNFMSYAEAEAKAGELDNVVPRQYEVINLAKAGKTIATMVPSDSKSGSDLTRNLDNNMVEQAHETGASSQSGSENVMTGATYQNKRTTAAGPATAADKTTGASSHGSGPAATLNSDRYTIKVSAHVVNLTAEKEVELFKSRGIETYIHTLPNSKNRIINIWVCHGDFASVQEAEENMQMLNQAIPGEYQIVAIGN